MCTFKMIQFDNSIKLNVNRRIVKLTENQIRSLISERLQNIITEDANKEREPVKYGNRFSITQKYGAERSKRNIASTYGIDVNDLYIEGDYIVYKPKKKPKKTSTKEEKKIVKPDDMDANTFFEKMVIPQMDSDKQDEARSKTEEIWKPLPNKNRYFNGELDPSEVVEVSNFGRVRIINCLDGMKSKITSGHYAPTRNMVQVHLSGVGDDGKVLKTTGSIANMVFDAFFDPSGEIDPKKYKVIHRDNDPQNCHYNNLDYVERKKEKKEKQ